MGELKHVKNTRLMSAVGATFVTAGLAAVGAGVGLAATATSASAEVTNKVYVCKYVMTPEGDEVLQGIISPAIGSLEGPPQSFPGTFPYPFGDAQARSVAIAYSGGDNPVLTEADCPGDEPTEPTETVTVTEPTETVTITDDPTCDPAVEDCGEGGGECDPAVEDCDGGPTSNPKPSDETETDDPTPTSHHDPDPRDDTEVTPDDPPTAVDAGIGAPAPAVTDEGSPAAIALGTSGGLLTLAGGLLLLGARRRGDQEA